MVRPEAAHHVAVRAQALQVQARQGEPFENVDITRVVYTFRHQAPHRLIVTAPVAVIQSPISIASKRIAVQIYGLLLAPGRGHLDRNQLPAGQNSRGRRPFPSAPVASLHSTLTDSERFAR